MKRNIFILLILVSLTFLNAKQFEILEFKLDPSDFYAELNPATDRNMKYCAAIKVEEDYPSDLSFKEKVFKKTEGAEEDYFFISSQEESLTLMADGVDSKEIKFSNVIGSQNLQMGKVYALRLNIVENEKLNIIIKTKPNNTDIFIDNNKLGISGQNLTVTKGEHNLTIKKDDYQTLNTKIQINENNQTFHFELEKQFGWFIYSVKPNDAQVTLGSVNVSEIREVKAPIGTYKLAIIKEGYEKYTDTIEIQPQKKVTRNYKLEKILNNDKAKQLEENIVSEETRFNQKVRDFEFKINKIYMESNILVIEAEFTNNDMDRELTVFGKASKLYDQNGNEYSIEEQMLGNKKSGWNNNITATLIEDVPTNSLIRFGDIKTSISKITKILLKCEYNNIEFEFIFRNIPVPFQR